MKKDVGTPNSHGKKSSDNAFCDSTKKSPAIKKKSPDTKKKKVTHNNKDYYFDSNDFSGGFLARMFSLREDDNGVIVMDEDEDSKLNLQTCNETSNLHGTLGGINSDGEYSPIKKSTEFQIENEKEDINTSTESFWETTKKKKGTKKANIHAQNDTMKEASTPAQNKTIAFKPLNSTLDKKNANSPPKKTPGLYSQILEAQNSNHKSNTPAKSPKKPVKSGWGALCSSSDESDSSESSDSSEDGDSDTDVSSEDEDHPKITQNKINTNFSENSATKKSTATPQKQPTNASNSTSAKKVPTRKTTEDLEIEAIMKKIDAAVEREEKKEKAALERLEEESKWNEVSTTKNKTSSGKTSKAALMKKRTLVLEKNPACKLKDEKERLMRAETKASTGAGSSASGERYVGGNDLWE